MNNNDILRRIRYIFDFNDEKMINIFGLADFNVSRSQISNWLKKEDETGFASIRDKQLAIFLDGLIIDKRGKQEGVTRKPEEELDNNIVLRKLKIALNLQNEEMLAILELTDMHLSKHELSAFFRNPKQAQYRPCKDQVLRNFLNGMQLKYRPSN